MLTIILAVTTAICAIGWLNRWVCCAALVMYIAGKNYTLPSEEETRACCTEVWNHLLHIK